MATWGILTMQGPQHLGWLLRWSLIAKYFPWFSPRGRNYEATQVIWTGRVVNRRLEHALHSTIHQKVSMFSLPFRRWIAYNCYHKWGWAFNQCTLDWRVSSPGPINPSPGLDNMRPRHTLNSHHFSANSFMAEWLGARWVPSRATRHSFTTWLPQ